MQQKDITRHSTRTCSIELAASRHMLHAGQFGVIAIAPEETDMPAVTVDVRFPYSKEEEVKIIDAVHLAMMFSLKTPDWDKTIFLSVFGGWPGAIIAQQVLRHKSIKTKFRSSFWGSVLVNAVLFIVLNSPVVSMLHK